MQSEYAFHGKGVLKERILHHTPFVLFQALRLAARLFVVWMMSKLDWADCIQLNQCSWKGLSGGMSAHRDGFSPGRARNWHSTAN
jgi:hypothetical protein